MLSILMFELFFGILQSSNPWGNKLLLENYLYF